MDKDSFPRRSITQAFISDILRQYFTARKPLTHKRIAAGIENETVVVRMGGAQYVIRIYNRVQFGVLKRTKPNILWELDFMEHLRRGRLPVPKVMPTLTGQKLSQVVVGQKAYFVAIFEFMSGRHVRKFNPQQIEAVIKLEAQMHQLSHSFASRHVRANTYQFGYEKLMLGDLGRKVAKYPKHKKILAELWGIVNQHYPKLEKLIQGRRQIAIHNDLNRGNIKFSGHTIAGVFDFDDALMGSPVSELGKTIFFIVDRELAPKLLMAEIERAIRLYAIEIKLTKKDVEIVKLAFLVSWASRRFHSFNGRIDERQKSADCVRFAKIYG